MTYDLALKISTIHTIKNNPLCIFILSTKLFSNTEEFFFEIFFFETFDYLSHCVRSKVFEECIINNNRRRGRKLLDFQISITMSWDMHNDIFHFLLQQQQHTHNNNEETTLIDHLSLPDRLHEKTSQSNSWISV